MAGGQEAIKQEQASTVEVVGAEPPPLRRLEIYCDGAVLDNPGGPGGWGFVARRVGEIIHRAHGSLFGKSNNQAEYQAVIEALKWIEAAGLTWGLVTIYSDSQLVINQINRDGIWVGAANS
jgi:ribonuclease HI